MSTLSKKSGSSSSSRSRSSSCCSDGGSGSTDIAAPTRQVVDGNTNNKDNDEHHDNDPSRPIPRDLTGRYLHLKLKRFKSVDDVTIKYAKSTWRKYPYNASVVDLSATAADSSPSNRVRPASCRWCHEKIALPTTEEGNTHNNDANNKSSLSSPSSDTLRYQLLLQCHKGCKNSAYFHHECFFSYPETKMLESVHEINGLDVLSPSKRQTIISSFKSLMLRNELQTSSKNQSDSGTKRASVDGSNQRTLKKNKKL